MRQLGAEEVADRILALEKGKGFQLARFGHCESRIMGFPAIFSREEVDRSLKLQLGDDTMSDADLSNISSRIRDVYQTCDIAGVTHIKLPRPNSEESDRLLMAIQSTASYYKLDDEGREFCSADIHLELLTSGLLDKIVSRFDHVVTVTCRELRIVLTDRFDKKVTQILIPQENRTAGLYEDLVRAKHYPDYFGNIISEVDKYAQAGTIFLIGAGFLGKIYGLQAKKRGAVVLDLGSVFDIWSGTISRGFFSGGKYDKYRLDFSEERRSGYSTPIFPSRRDWVVDVSRRHPVWIAADQIASCVLSATPNKTSISNASEIFIHSSVDGKNSATFKHFLSDFKATAICATLVVTHKQAKNTVFRITARSRSGEIQEFEEVCGGDSMTHWVGLLPQHFEVDSLCLTCVPIDGAVSSYGWCYYRNLRMY